MKKILEIPHRVCKSTCFSNGLEDILEWNNKKYIDYLVPVIGGMGEFTYLKNKNMTPQNMVYWGANTKYLMKDLENIIGFKQRIIENRSFKNTFIKIKEFINNNKPIIAGALDMYYLHYYQEIYHKKHIPIHYVLVVGYDDNEEKLFVHDNSCKNIQYITYKDFEMALNVNVPGMSKKNTIRIFELPKNLPSELELAEKGFKFRANKMLYPPIKIFGIPAMRKFAKEIFNWNDKESFEHLIIYATTPPELPKNFKKSDGMRFWKSEVLKVLGEKYNNKQWIEQSKMFEESGKLIIEICKAASKQDRKMISNLITEVANIEEKAYKLFIK